MRVGDSSSFQSWPKTKETSWIPKPEVNWEPFGKSLTQEWNEERVRKKGRRDEAQRLHLFPPKRKIFRLGQKRWRDGAPSRGSSILSLSITPWDVKVLPCCGLLRLVLDSWGLGKFLSHFFDKVVIFMLSLLILALFLLFVSLPRVPLVQDRILAQVWVGVTLVELKTPPRT